MPPGTIRTVLLIAGMRDNACRECIARMLEAVAGVKEVDVNLYRARATILHDPFCGPADLLAAVARAGYSAVMAAPRDGAKPTPSPPCHDRAENC